MNAIPALLAVIVLLLVYIILFVHGKEKPKDNPNTVSQIPIRKEKTVSIIGKTRTSFPSQGTERKPEKADENRKEKSPTFAPESSSEENENEFHPMAPENEIDANEVAREELSILLDEEIEVSDESLTEKEIRRIRQAVKQNTVSEQEKRELQKTVAKLQGSDFLEKLKEHEALQQNRSAELMRLLVGNENPEDKTDTELPKENWMSFL